MNRLLVRDQGVGGSNPLSPTKLFIINRICWLSLVLDVEDMGLAYQIAVVGCEMVLQLERKQRDTLCSLGMSAPPSAQKFVLDEFFTSEGTVSRHWTVSGFTQLQSGPPSTFNFQGVDSNGDGSTTNDRPVVGNRNQPLNTAGIDGIYLGAPAPGQYFDLAALNGPGTIVPVTPDQVHWLIPYGPPFVSREVGRNSFRNPGSTVWNVALQKDIPVRWTRLENAAFNLRCEASDLGNHNDVGILDTNLLHINSGNTYLNPATKLLSTARNVRFWAKFTF
jgi:hypothetical protein